MISKFAEAVRKDVRSRGFGAFKITLTWTKELRSHHNDRAVSSVVPVRKEGSVFKQWVVYE